MCLQKLEIKQNSPENSNPSELERDIQELMFSYYISFNITNIYLELSGRVNEVSSLFSFL